MPQLLTTFGIFLCILALLIVGISGFTAESFALAAIVLVAGFLASLFVVDSLRPRQRLTAGRPWGQNFQRHLRKNRTSWALGLALTLATTVAAYEWIGAPALSSADPLALATRAPIAQGDANPESNSVRALETAAPSQPEAPNSVNMSEEVAASVESWRQAWEAQDIAKYLAAYSPDFKPADGATLAVWRAQRQDRVGRARDISITVDQLEVTVDGNQASARFRQRYSAAQTQDSMRKHLRLLRIGDRWQIIIEKPDEPVDS